MSIFYQHKLGIDHDYIAAGCESTFASTFFVPVTTIKTLIKKPRFSHFNRPLCIVCHEIRTNSELGICSSCRRELIKYSYQKQFLTTTDTEPLKATLQDCHYCQQATYDTVCHDCRFWINLRSYHKPTVDIYKLFKLQYPDRKYPG